MAGEARAEIPAPAAPTLPVPQKRVVREEDGGEGVVERPEPKRRRASVAALDGVSCAAAADGEAEAEDGHVDGDGLSFSFQHARGGFGALETTPKFGSFHPPAPLAEQAALDPKPAPPAGEDPPLVEEEDAASARGVGDGEGGNSRLVMAVGDQGQPGGQTDAHSHF